jgi:hypothetical protein
MCVVENDAGSTANIWAITQKKTRFYNLKYVFPNHSFGHDRYFGFVLATIFERNKPGKIINPSQLHQK